MIFQRDYFSRAALALCFLTLLLIIGCTSKQENAASVPHKIAAPEPVTCCYGGAMPALLAVAVSREMFTHEGLTVTIKSFPLGNKALDELFTGECDFANLAETPVVIRSFERSDFTLLASLRSTDNLGRIVARRDKGIHSLADLKGRRVGITKGTVPHYFLDLELAKYGMGSKDIIPVYIESDKLLQSLADGSVDAIATINSMVFRARENLGENVVVFEEPGLGLNYSLLVTKKESAAKYPKRIESLLKALNSAESYSRQSPEKKREIVVASMKLTEVEYETVWKKYDDRLSLDNALLLTLEENARWALDKGIVKKRQIPNYLALIDAGFLMRVAPDAVRLKR